jgi:hypothetical protein
MFSAVKKTELSETADVCDATKLNKESKVGKIKIIQNTTFNI